MSELTTCNYCSLRAIRRRAKEENSRVYVRNAHDFGLGGYDVFMVPKGEKLNTSVDEKGEHGEHWVSWMMEITDHCCC